MATAPTIRLGWDCPPNVIPILREHFPDARILPPGVPDLPAFPEPPPLLDVVMGATGCDRLGCRIRWSDSVMDPAVQYIWHGDDQMEVRQTVSLNSWEQAETNAHQFVTWARDLHERDDPWREHAAMLAGAR